MSMSSETDHTPSTGRSSAAPKSGSKTNAKVSARSKARGFALQALYQWRVSGNDVDSIDQFTRDLSGFHKCDAVHYDALLHGIAQEHQALDALIVPLLDRPQAELSPIEHCTMLMGAYELRHCKDIPWRVVLNEAIELAKSFGGTDGHKYVNAVLVGLAPSLRPHEMDAPPKTGQHPGSADAS